MITKLGSRILHSEEKINKNKSPSMTVYPHTEMQHVSISIHS